MSYGTTGLRTDERQWLIYGEEQQGAVMRGLEAWALLLAGARMRQHPLLPLRAIGTFMRKVGEQRLAEMDRNDGAQRVVAGQVKHLLGALAGRVPWTADTDRDADELYATVFHLDSRATGAGMTGEGTHRAAVRGD